MTPLPVPRRWLAALLGAAFLADILIVASIGGGGKLALPGAAVMLACAYRAVDRPAPAALAGAVTLLASSVLIRLTDTRTAWIGIQNIVLSEVIAGAVLTVFVAWRSRAAVAAVATSALVAGCLAAMAIRTAFGEFSFHEREFLPSLLFGLALLAVCVVTGVYLRQSTQVYEDPELRDLIGRQWPLAATLAVLFLIDLRGFVPRLFTPPNFVTIQSGAVGFPSSSAIGLAGAAIAAGCAFLAPRAPVRYALAGAAAVGVLPLLFGGVGVTLTQVAASMALIAFLTRYARPQPALLGTAALVAANLVTFRVLGYDLPPVGFLLVVSVITGLYFRVRDRERHQSVRTAVTGAQQAERMALARELHDVVAHHVTGMVVQAQGARMVAEDDPRAAALALEKIENSGTEALAAMRMLVGSMRDGTAAAGGSVAAEQATSDLAADIRAVADGFPGPAVELELDLPELLPHEVGRSVLRLVQESLTNVSKHAPDASTVQVHVAGMGNKLHVRVADDGNTRRSTPVGDSGGYGLIGMRERVELLGGRFTAGPADGGGWLVKASLPLRKEDA